MKLITVNHKAYTWLVYVSIGIAGLPVIVSIIIRLITGNYPWNGRLIDFNGIWFIAFILLQLILSRTLWRGLVYEIRINNGKIAFNYLVNKSYYSYLADVTMTEDDKKIYFSDDKKLKVYLFKKDLREEDYVTLKEMVGR